MRFETLDMRISMAYLLMLIFYAVNHSPQRSFFFLFEGNTDKRIIFQLSVMSKTDSPSVEISLAY